MKAVSAGLLLCFLVQTSGQLFGGPATATSMDDPTNPQDEVPDADALARRSAARLLMAPRTSAGQPDQSLPALALAAKRAALELPGTRIAQLLSSAVDAARWQATLDPEQARLQLEGRLAELASDLSFEPRMEAPLPQGFPLPTAIHELEIKHYPRYRLAQTSMEGGLQGGAFWRLFGHIQQNEIPMTAPVETTLSLTEGRLTEKRMAFLYEGPEQGPTSAQNPEVTIETIEPMTVLSIGCRGNDSRPRLQAASELFDAWLATHPEWRPAGDLRVFGYNSPMMRGDQRTFEVQLPIEPQS